MPQMRHQALRGYLDSCTRSHDQPPLLGSEVLSEWHANGTSRRVNLEVAVKRHVQKMGISGN